MTDRKIPKGWGLAPIGSLCTLQNGRAFKPTDWTPDGLPIIRIQNLNNPKATYNHFSGEVEDRFLVAPRELLFAWSGTPGTSFGAHIWTGDRAILNQHIFKIRLNEQLLDKAYLRLAINERLDALIDKAHGGAGLAHVTKGRFEETEILVPPLPEQRRIAAKIDAVFAQTRAAKARLERLPALIEKLKRSILAAAFRGDLTADWRAANPDVEPASALLDLCNPAPSGAYASSCTAAEQPVIPTTWRCVPLEALVTEGPSNGYSPPAGEHATGTSSLRLSATTQGRLVLNEETIKRLHEIVPATSKYWLRPGDLLIQRANSLEYVGMAVIFDGPADQFVYPDLMMRVRTAHRAVGEWLKHALTLARLNGYFARRATGTAGNMPKINGSVVRSVPIVVPPLEELTVAVGRISDALAAMEAVAPRLRRAIEHADALERTALASAFRGELVPQDPADEPAEVLLARLRAAKAEEAPVARRSRAAAPEPTYAAPPITLAQAAESGPLFQHALERRERAAPEPAAQDLVVAALQQSDGRLTAAAIAQTTGLAPAAVRAALQDLIAAGQVHTHGKARGTTYTWAG